jgi:hypothetical protein
MILFLVNSSLRWFNNVKASLLLLASRTWDISSRNCLAGKLFKPTPEENDHYSANHS